MPPFPSINVAAEITLKIFARFGTNACFFNISFYYYFIFDKSEMSWESEYVLWSCKVVNF